MERVVEIVSFVIRQYLTKSNGEIGSEQTIVNELFKLGYTRQEVETAFGLMCLIPNYLDSKVEQLGQFTHIRTGHRVFSPVERRKLTVACQGELMRLVNSSLITRDELEVILTEAFRNESNEVGLRELESILHKLISDKERLLMILQYPTDGPSFYLN